MASLKRWLEARRHPWKREALEAMSQWKRTGGHHARLLQYSDLSQTPVVWDVGGYEGAWTDIVKAERPAAEVHVFEPHPRFAMTLAAKFSETEGVHVHPFAVGSADGTLALDDTEDASSAYGRTEGAVTGDVRAVGGFWSNERQIDLVKMNIEGGEYDLLPAMLDAGIMPLVDRLQVQFHLFEEPLVAARASIRQRLDATHDCVWCYPFVWEEWRRRT